ncbi:MAG: dienelactone hydrolase family protein [Propionibacteriaceae bacterium]
MPMSPDSLARTDPPRMAEPLVLTETVQLEVSGDASMAAYVARPDRIRPRGGVLVAMELFGVSAHTRDICERLARLGYWAIAPDLYHRVAPGVELASDEAGRARGFELLATLTRAPVLADLAAASTAIDREGIGLSGLVGLSVGGHVGFLAAAQLDLPTTVLCYPGWLPTTDIALSRPEPTLACSGAIRGRLLLLVGEKDPVVPPEHLTAIVAALQQARVEHELVEYPGVGHGFLCDRRLGYDAAAAEDAWRRIDRALAGRHAG